MALVTQQQVLNNNTSSAIKSFFFHEAKLMLSKILQKNYQHILNSSDLKIPGSHQHLTKTTFMSTSNKETGQINFISQQIYIGTLEVFH